MESGEKFTQLKARDRTGTSIKLEVRDGLSVGCSTVAGVLM